MTTKTPAYAALKQSAPLQPHTIERRDLGADDVQINITHCGVCHSDLHMVENDWGMSAYPLVPGHEVIGHVAAVGANVTAFKVGDRAAVGCMVDSCRKCKPCHDGLEQFCPTFTMTYGSPTKDAGGVTYGGYSKQIVVNKDFVLSVPENLDMAGAAPLLCAGITTYSPLKHWKVGKGMRVGIIGLGGLGHMGVKFAAAMGAETVMITTSPEKGEDAKKLGAHDVLISKDADAMAKNAESFDFLLNTIPVKHEIDPYMALLKYDCTMCMVGALEPMPGFHGSSLIFRRKSVAGSLIGGIRETQEMLDFCGQHNITSDIELIKMGDINTAYQRMVKSDVKYRFVIDMASLEAA